MSLTLQCDVHTHTLYSRHAFSTIEENVRAAREQGLSLLGTTDHFSSILYPDFQELRHYQYLFNCHLIPNEWMGIRILKGCEADIVDMDGHLFGWDIEVDHSITGDPFTYGSPRSLYTHVTNRMDYVIASVHGKYFARNATETECTEMYIRAMDNPKVLIIGHIGRSGLPVNVDEILLAAKAKHCLIEINEHSYGGNTDCWDKCRHIAERCAELEVPVSVSSDAHISASIGKLTHSIRLLEEISFPEELIASRNAESFLKAIRHCQALSS